MRVLVNGVSTQGQRAPASGACGGRRGLARRPPGRAAEAPGRRDPPPRQALPPAGLGLPEPRSPPGSAGVWSRVGAREDRCWPRLACASGAEARGRVPACVRWLVCVTAWQSARPAGVASVCAFLAGPSPPLHLAGSCRPGAPGRLGPSSLQPRPFHPLLLRPGLATAPVITRGRDAAASWARRSRGGGARGEEGRGRGVLASEGRGQQEARPAPRTVNTSERNRVSASRPAPRSRPRPPWRARPGGGRRAARGSRGSEVQPPTTPGWRLARAWLTWEDTWVWASYVPLARSPDPCSGDRRSASAGSVCPPPRRPGTWRTW